MRRLAILAFLLPGFLGCVSLRNDMAATLRLDCNVPDAVVLVDGSMLGSVAEFTKVDRHIRPGFYRVEIRHPGYYTHYTEFEVEDQGVAQVKATLHPVLD